MNGTEQRSRLLEQAAGEAMAISAAALASHEGALSERPQTQAYPESFPSNVRQLLIWRNEFTASAEPRIRAAAAREIAYAGRTIVPANRSFI